MEFKKIANKEDLALALDIFKDNLAPEVELIVKNSNIFFIIIFPLFFKYVLLWIFGKEPWLSPLERVVSN